jgi:hypothetical protein
MRIEQRAGGYSFLKGVTPYSAGVVASPGFEIERVRLERPLALDEGFTEIERYLEEQHRRRRALCAIELRSPRPFTFGGFQDFNQRYVAILERWQILVDGLNPVARTNVAPEIDPPAEPSLYAFSITLPVENAPLSFIVAGAGELPEGSLDPHDVVRRGETSAAAIRAKARFVMERMSSRLAGLAATWGQVTAAQIYTVRNIHPFLAKGILRPMREAASLGVTWHYARPPIESIEFEMDLRGCRREVIFPAAS